MRCKTRHFEPEEVSTELGVDFWGKDKKNPKSLV